MEDNFPQASTNSVAEMAIEAKYTNHDRYQMSQPAKTK